MFRLRDTRPPGALGPLRATRDWAGVMGSQGSALAGAAPKAS